MACWKITHLVRFFPSELNLHLYTNPLLVQYDKTMNFGFDSCLSLGHIDKNRDIDQPSKTIKKWWNRTWKTWYVGKPSGDGTLWGNSHATKEEPGADGAPKGFSRTWDGGVANFFPVWHHPYKFVREKPKAVPKTDFRVVPGGSNLYKDRTWYS